MYSVYKPNDIEDLEIEKFIKSSEHSILVNDTPSSVPSLTGPGTDSNTYSKELLKHFNTLNLVYKQTKNGEPVFIRKATNDPMLMEDGYLTLEFGLINFYNGTKSFIYDQEFWGWATILANSETTEAYRRVIDLGLLGDDVHMAPFKIKGQAVPGYSKVKVTF
mgnify:CR=1 FL=1